MTLSENLNYALFYNFCKTLFRLCSHVLCSISDYVEPSTITYYALSSSYDFVAVEPFSNRMVITQDNSSVLPPRPARPGTETHQQKKHQQTT